MKKADVYAALLFAAVGLAVPAVVALRHFLGVDILPFVKPATARTVLGAVLALAATLGCALNVYLSFIAPRLYESARGGMEGYDAPSGLPVLGNVFVLGAGALLPESAVLGAFLLALYALDTGGVPWLFIHVLR